jgi:hypothetical protein
MKWFYFRKTIELFGRFISVAILFNFQKMSSAEEKVRALSEELRLKELEIEALQVSFSNHFKLKFYVLTKRTFK